MPRQAPTLPDCALPLPVLEGDSPGVLPSMAWFDFEESTPPPHAATSDATAMATREREGKGKEGEERRGLIAAA
jgi:hypothetical protein